MKKQKNNQEKDISIKNTIKESKHLGIKFAFDLHRKFKAICKHEHRSMTSTVLRLIQHYVSDFEKSYFEQTQEKFDFDKWL